MQLMKRKKPKAASTPTLSEYATRTPTGGDPSNRDIMDRAVAGVFRRTPAAAAGGTPVIPLPDEDEIERVRRRRAARRGGGRASTVLSDDDRMGG